MTALSSDNFDRADTGNIAGSGTPVWNGPKTGLTPIGITSNTASVSEVRTNDSAYNDTFATWPNDQYSQAVMTLSAGTTFQTGDGPGLAVRIASGTTNTLYRLIVSHSASNNVSVAKVVTGGTTNLGNRTQAWTDGDTWYLEVSGTSLQPKLNGTNVGAAITDSAIAAGAAGLAYSSENSGSAISTWNNWEGGSLAGLTTITRTATPVSCALSSQVTRTATPTSCALTKSTNQHARPVADVDLGAWTPTP